MEDIQLLDNPKKEENELKINELTKMYLTTIYKWAKFFAVMTFIVSGIMFLAALFMIAAGGIRHDLFGGFGFSSMFGLLYIIIAAIYILPGIFLNNFSSKLKNAILYTNNNELQEAFKNLKSLFKFFGILTIVFISLYILIFIVAIIVAVVAGFSAF